MYLSAEIVTTFVACVYYRRGVSLFAVTEMSSPFQHVLPHSRFFNYSGWRRMFFFAFLLVYSLTVIRIVVHFLEVSIRSSQVEYSVYHPVYLHKQALLPAELNWVKHKTSYVFFRPEANAIYANCGKLPGKIFFVNKC